MAEMQNLRFGVKLMPAKSPLDEDEMSLYIKGEYGGESYGVCVRILCGAGGRMEVPAEAFEKAVSQLRFDMIRTEAELQRRTAGCRWCINEICTNDKCPMCADFCPVPNDTGVCRHEERGG